MRKWTGKCALCGEPAVTAVLGVSICMDHYIAYQKEGRKYLPVVERKLYNAIYRLAYR